jgi:hypothetical protein
MDSKPRAILRPPPAPIAADSAGSPRADESPAPRAESVAGELTPGLIREWGPLLKPTGIGLLVALHSFEETTPGHPYYGWAHCTQNALAAYLDTSQDTIARYTNLLQTTGLLQVEEVETPRGKQKLYRTARGLPLPSLALLEYLVFDANTWTRKHVAWLMQRLAPLGPDTELTRLAAIMRRAYQVNIDSRGLGQVDAAARLTRPNSYVRRGEPAAHQPGLLPPDSASCGLVAAASAQAPEQPISASSGQPPAPGPAQAPGQAASSGQGTPDGPMPASESASCRQAGSIHMEDARQDSAWSGQVQVAGNSKAEESAWSGDEESAQGGLGAGAGRSVQPAAGKESAESGATAGMESALCGLAGAALVNVDRSTVNESKNENVNDAPAVLPAPGGILDPGDAEALIGWGTRMLGDGHSLDWHRQCLAENGADTYRWAIEATCRAQARGKVSKPGAYFTSLLRRRRGSGAAASPEQAAPTPAVPPPAATLQLAAPFVSPSGPAPVPATPVATSGLNEADCGRTWQAALVHLRIGLPAEDYTRVLRYAVLLELDPVSGWALLGLPTDFMREQVAGRLAAPIGAALGQICGASINLAAIVLPGQGRLAGNRPTLASLLAQRAEGPQA